MLEVANYTAKPTPALLTRQLTTLPFVNDVLLQWEEITSKKD